MRHRVFRGRLRRAAKGSGGLLRHARLAFANLSDGLIHAKVDVTCELVLRLALWFFFAEIALHLDSSGACLNVNAPAVSRWSRGMTASRRVPRGADAFVTSTAAPIASGWSEPVPWWDFHPRLLLTAHSKLAPGVRAYLFSERVLCHYGSKVRFVLSSARSLLVSRSRFLLPGD
jgi:hypothetical protein